MKPVDQGSASNRRSPALHCRVVPGPSPASPRAHAAAGAPAPPISPPSSQHRLSSRRSACVSPGAKSQLVFIQALKPPPKSFLAFTTLFAASALPITMVSGSRRAGGRLGCVFYKTCHLPARDLCLPTSRRVSSCQRQASTPMPASIDC